MNKLHLDAALALYGRAAASEAAALFFDHHTVDADTAQAKVALVRLGVFLPDLSVPNAQGNRKGVTVTPLADDWKATPDQTLAKLKAKLAQSLLGGVKS